MREPEVIPPPKYHIMTHTMQLRMDAEFAAVYDRYAEVCRATYNWAVAEAMLDGPERREHLAVKRRPKKGKDGKKDGEDGEHDGPYFDRGTYKLAKDVAKEAGVDVSVVRDMVREQVGDRTWYYRFPPSSRDTYNRIGLLLTKMRAEHGWARDCPVQYELGAVHAAVTAADRSISDNSDRMPFRPSGRRAPLFCPSNQAVNRRGLRELRVPGFTLHTKKPIPKHWDIRSCSVVETTPYRTRTTGRGSRTFEVHVQVRVRTKPRRANTLARAVDVGGRHVAASADTTQHTTIQTMPHGNVVRQVRSMQSRRDKMRKGGHAWKAINKKMRMKRGKARRVAKNARLQGAAYVARNVLVLAFENIDIKAMARHGGNRKRMLNDMLKLAGVGVFRRAALRSAARNGTHVMLVDAANSSNECVICDHTDRESRASRDLFVCVNCGDEAHADANAACALLKRATMWLADRAEGQAVLRRRAKPRNKPTQWQAWPRQRGAGPPNARWGRQKVTQVEVLP